MAIELTEFSEAVWYVPDFKDNRESTDPCRILVLPMTGAELQRIEESNLGKVKKSGSNWLKRYHKIRAQILTRCIKEICGLSKHVHGPDGIEVVPISTGADFVKHAGEPFLEELIEGVKDQSTLAEGVEKKLKSLSGSCTRTIEQPSLGSVKAVPNSSNGPETAKQTITPALAGNGPRS